MEGEEMEAVMERAWDLHDKMSDAIHSLCKSLFFSSIGNQKQMNPSSHFSHSQPPHIYNLLSIPSNSSDDDLFTEITSLNAIRNALETLENQLYLLQTLQVQQRAEKDAALMQLEESRRILLKRLKEHRGRDMSIIKEALAFASDGDEAGDSHLNPNVFQDCSMAEANKALSTNKNDERHNNTADLQKKCQGGLAYLLDFGYQFVKNSDNLHAVAGVVTKVALVAVSMFAIFRLQQTPDGTRKEDRRSKASRMQKNTRQYTEHQRATNGEDYFAKNSVRESTKLPGHYRFTSLDVLFGRG
ncbi:plastid division protein PDV1 isoform X1 [Cryptomeria japonica]|uniref:plastid division protein PDV1 isoform X1 n=1 Tax=Cryptomeria japonica TaxID=3369 RepID=UPI0025AD50E0|nr:plastid division protein PDV1 isoform X1 [Cryptomeria japonica]